MRFNPATEDPDRPHTVEKLAIHPEYRCVYCGLTITLGRDQMWSSSVGDRFCPPPFSAGPHLHHRTQALK